MKKIFTIALILMGSLFAKAQAPLQAGEVAPNFTYADINNVSHTLYNYLDSGYTVIMDISATWCGPCWAVHNSHVFDSLTHHYGINGTIDPKKIKVFFFEGDATTNTADLNGTGSNTQGNWVTGSNYTIIDNAAIKTQYPIDGYPHFYVVCPNRMISFSQAGYSAAMLTEPFWVNYQGDCPVKVTGSNASTISSATETSICAGGSTVLKAKIQNMGTVPMTSATINAKVGANTIATYNWSGSLNTYDVTDVTIGNYTFNPGQTLVDYEVVLPGDVQANDNIKSKSLSALTSPIYNWRLVVKTDQYPGETTWKIKNASNVVVDQHTYTPGTGTDGAGGPDAGQIFIYNLMLNQNECYTFEITDTYGDGLFGVQAAADTGYIKLFDDVSMTTPLINFGGDYGTGINGIAKTGNVLSNVEFSLNNNIELFPNPANNEITIKGLKGNVNFKLVDVLGRTVKTFAATTINQIAKLQIAEIPNGNYILKIEQDGNVQTKSVLIQH